MDKAVLRIYELKGMMSGLDDIEGMDHPIVERLQLKVAEIIALVEEDS